MSTASRKAKGRRLQDNVVKQLRQLGKAYGLTDDDIKPALMGSKGVDVVLSPAAQKVFDVKIECKNQEKLIVTAAFVTHFSKYHYIKETKAHNGDTSLKVLIHDKNYMREGPLVTIRMVDFFSILQKAQANILEKPFLSTEKDAETA
jgi:hypothetical protein